MTTYSVVPVQTGIHCGNDTLLIGGKMKKILFVVLGVLLIVSAVSCTIDFHPGRDFQPKQEAK